MNDLPGNGYVAVSKFRTEGLHEWQGDEGMTDATHITTAIDANTQATLALAFEQRTAILIAWMSLGVNASASGVEITDEVRRDICERLGVEVEES